jgi:hypothetical protein
VKILSVALSLAVLLGASHAAAQGAPGAGLLGVGAPQLVMPAPTPLTPEQQRTIQRLDLAKRLDSGRGLDVVWIDAEGGFEQLGLQTFNGGDQGFVGGLVKTSSSGASVGAGAGAHLLFLTLLLRARVGVFDVGQLYRIGPEVGFHVPFGRVEPHAALGLGYAAVGGLKDTVGGSVAGDFALRGFYTRVTAGLDYYPTPVFSIGASLSTDLLVMVRPALSAAEVTYIQSLSNVSASQKSSAALLTSTGTGAGGTLAVSAVAGLHF